MLMVFSWAISENHVNKVGQGFVLSHVFLDKYTLAERSQTLIPRKANYRQSNHFLFSTKVFNSCCGDTSGEKFQKDSWLHITCAVKRNYIF